MEEGMLWRTGCDGRALRCDAGDRHQQRGVVLDYKRGVKRPPINAGAQKTPCYFKIYAQTPALRELSDPQRQPKYVYANDFWCGGAMGAQELTLHEDLDSTNERRKKTRAESEACSHRK